MCPSDLISSYRGQQVSVTAPQLSWPVAASGFREFLSTLIFVCLERDQQGRQAGRAKAVRDAFSHLLAPSILHASLQESC